MSKLVKTEKVWTNVREYVNSKVECTESKTSHSVLGYLNKS